MYTFLRSKLKFLITTVFITACMISQAQNITVFPLLTTNDAGVQGSMIEFKDSLYFQYYASFSEIAKFNGNSYRLLRGQSTFTYGVNQCPFVYDNNLYYRFKRLGNSYLIGRINNDTSVTTFTNPDSGVGFGDSTTLFNGQVYFIYTNAAGKRCLASFDGSVITVFAQPDAGDGFYGKFLVNNGNLYATYQDQNYKQVLAKFDGIGTTLYNRNSFGYGIESNLVAYNNGVYFLFNDSIGHFTGSSIETYPNPVEMYASGILIEFHNKLWYKAYKDIQKYQVTTFDGNVVEMVGDIYNEDIGFNDKFIFQDHLYFSFENSTIKHQLARLDGYTITKIPNISTDDLGIRGMPVNYRNNLYFQYLSPNGIRGQLAKYDGLDLTLFSDPPGITQYKYQPFLVYKNALYLTYNIGKTYLARLSDSIVNTSLCVNGNQQLASNLPGIIYQWQLDAGSGFNDITGNGNYSGTTTSILSITNIPGTAAGYKYRCLVDGNYSEIYQLRFINEWTGSVNNAWEEPGNWSCGTLPDANTDVVINAGTIVLNSNTTIHSLHLNQLVSFTVNPGMNLIVLH